MRKTPMVTIYKNGRRIEAYTDGTAVIEDCATGEIIEDFLGGEDDN